MLGKLLKHEFIATGRIMGALYAVVALIMAYVLGSYYINKDTASTGQMLGITVLLLISSCSFILTAVVMIVNFQRSLYVVENRQALRKEYPDDELIFLVGSDMLLSFHTWRKPEEILRCVKICAVSRDSSADEASMQKYIDEHFYEDRDRFIICSFTPIEISSTQVRNAVRNGEPTNIFNRRVHIRFTKSSHFVHAVVISLCGNIIGEINNFFKQAHFCPARCVVPDRPYNFTVVNANNKFYISRTRHRVPQLFVGFFNRHQLNARLAQYP
mgnify:CR=1 FL=1